MSLHVHAESALHLHILLQPFDFTGVNNAHKAGFAEIPVLTHQSLASARTCAG